MSGYIGAAGVGSDCGEYQVGLTAENIIRDVSYWDLAPYSTYLPTKKYNWITYRYKCNCCALNKVFPPIEHRPIQQFIHLESTRHDNDTLAVS